MIIVLFTAGNFGSTIEFCLREFSQELSKVQTQVLQDGSMHGFYKEMHLPKIEHLEKHRDHGVEVLTPTWPGLDYLSPSQTLKQWEQQIIPSDKVIFVSGSSMTDWEQTIMFAHHKLKNMHLDIVMKNKAHSWNPIYKSWRDMRRFELREALSFYVDQQLACVDIDQLVPKTWCLVHPNQILYEMESTVNRMLAFCGLARNDKSIENFYQHWFSKQQYIIEECRTIDLITQDFLAGTRTLSWKPLSIMGEAIVQSRLRRQGVELLCQDLDTFPTDSRSLQDHCSSVG